MDKKPIAIVTGASRKIGIGAAISVALAQSGWNVALTYWRPYDKEMPWGSQHHETEELLALIRQFDADAIGIEADLAKTDTPAALFEQVKKQLGTPDALIMSHCMSVDSDIFTTTIDSFDQHFAINARAVWLLVREFGKYFDGVHGSGRIISITSDHTAGNLPYGASKGAMDRIVLAAAEEFKHLGITANVINPGPTDTGWMDQELLDWAQNSTPLGRVGTAKDCANLVQFLCSPEGGWVNGQLLMSNGGIQ